MDRFSPSKDRMYIRLTRHKEYWNILIAAFTNISLIIILLTFVHPFNGHQLQLIYIFDFVVTTFLAIDFYFRIRASPHKLRYVISHWYEFPAMIPLVVFGGLDAMVITNNPVLSFKLIAFFRLARLYNLVRYIRANDIFLLTGIGSDNNYFRSSWHIHCRSSKSGCKYNIFGQCILVRHRNYHNCRIWRILPGYRVRKSDLIVLDVRSNRNNVDTSCLGFI